MGSEYEKAIQKGMAAYRAPSLLQPHKARQAVRDAYEGRINPLIGYYCGVGSIPTARIMAQMGADVIWVDWEHSSMGVESMTTVSMPMSLRWRSLIAQIVHEIQFMSEGRTIPFVRSGSFSLLLSYDTS